MNDLILYVSFGVAIAVSFFSFKKLELTDALNIAILAFTALALVWTTIDSKRNFTESQIADLRPILLRSGFILDWKVQSVEDVNITGKPQFIEFTNDKNIAKDIKGHMIIGGKKFILLFGNEVSQETSVNGDATMKKIGVVPKWGWLSTDGKLFATFEKQNYEITTEPNQIYLEYKDIEGNSYFTKEDSQFSQTSGRIQKN